MKNFILLMTIILSIGTASLAQDHSHHAKHNMVLFGEADSYYVSHIVYKVPHNFQIILKINLSSIVKAKVASEMSTYPNDEFIYLLDHMDISKIDEKPTLSGQVFRRTADGTKHVIFEKVGLRPEEYSIIYFNELPLSLGI